MLWARIAAIFMFLAVAIGAFGAHGLKQKLNPEMLSIFETAVRYHVYHALGLFVVSWLSEKTTSSIVNASGWAFVLGIVIFSGSLYILSITGVRWLGAITPIGGACFLVGWIILATQAVP